MKSKANLAWQLCFAHFPMFGSISPCLGAFPRWLVGVMGLRLFVFDISFFSGKLEAYLRYRGIPFERVEVTWWQLASQIAPKTGLMEVPVLHDTTNDVWLSDSTPIIEYFEGLRSTPKGVLPIIPECPVQQFFSFLIGDFADEWLWRPAIYYRWHYALDRDLYSRRFVKDFLFFPIVPDWIIRWLTAKRMIRGYLQKDGIRDKDTRCHTESIYLRALAALQAHFEEYPFMAGSHPTLLDFCLFASMFRHFSLDPTPSRIMRDSAPAVYEWVARMWNARMERSILTIPLFAAPPLQIPASWHLLMPLVRQYLLYLQANCDAHRLGEKTFNLTLEGISYRDIEVVPYHTWRRERLQERLADLSLEEQTSVRAILSCEIGKGCWEALLEAPWKSERYNHRNLPPFTRGDLSFSRWWRKVAHFITGTPRHQSGWVFPFMTELILFLALISIPLWMIFNSFL